jgi:hypothetical protein
LWLDFWTSKEVAELVNGSVGGIRNKTEKKSKWCILCCPATLGGECGICGREKTSGGVRVGRLFKGE